MKRAQNKIKHQPLKPVLWGTSPTLSKTLIMVNSLKSFGPAHRMAGKVGTLRLFGGCRMRKKHQQERGTSTLFFVKG
jgi:hypothetical protein